MFHLKEKLQNCSLLGYVTWHNLADQLKYDLIPLMLFIHMTSFTYLNYSLLSTLQTVYFHYKIQLAHYTNTLVGGYCENVKSCGTPCLT